LIELLTVIAIFAILAAILIPVVGTVRKSASSSHSVSNLRQISVAINMYANDHQGRLPGPVNSGQSPLYRGDREEDATGNLAFRIRQYVDEELNGATSGYAEIFTYPGWIANTKDLNGISYFVNREPLPGVFPLGQRLADNNDNMNGLTWAQLSNYDLGSKRWISEADQENIDIPRAAGWFSNLPEQAVHGNFRNVLFFDGHVEAIRLEDYRLD
jgi:prepilin-type processing-associated H-X9-DG protein